MASLVLPLCVISVREGHLVLNLDKLTYAGDVC